jgi:hypothetical protein
MDPDGPAGFIAATLLATVTRVSQNLVSSVVGDHLTMIYEESNLDSNDMLKVIVRSALKSKTFSTDSGTGRIYQGVCGIQRICMFNPTSRMSLIS